MGIGFFFWPYNVALVRGMAEAADRFGYDMMFTVSVASDPLHTVQLFGEKVLPAIRAGR